MGRKRKKVTQKATRKTLREIPMSMLPNMNARSSVRLKLRFKAKMVAIMFEMAVVIPKIMTISRTTTRGKEGIEISSIHLGH